MFLYKIFNENEVNWRSKIGFFVIFSLFLLLLIRVFYLQIFNYNYFYEQSFKNSFSYSMITPDKGIIFDRHNNVIADNSVSYQIYGSFDNFPDNDNYQWTHFLYKLNNLFPDYDDSNLYERISNNRNSHNFLIKRSANFDIVGKILSDPDYYHEFNIVGRKLRHHLYPDEMSSFLGYLGQTTSVDLQKNFIVNNSLVGKSGVEEYYNDLLYGKPGLKESFFNSRRQLLSSNIIQKPVQGNNLYTTIDLVLQKKIFELMDGKKGAVVVSNVNNGEILGFVSTPGFNSNLFSEGINQLNFKSIQKSGALFNRALQGQYAPASTLKPFVALALLEGGFVDTNDILWNGPYWQIPGKSQRYREWNQYGHGDLNIQEALARSSNVFFYQTSYEAGFDYISDYLSIFGFGQKTNIDLNRESSGLNPNSSWKNRRFNEPWYEGETLVNSIGQGYFLVTPLQLNFATSAIANGGYLYKPKIIKNTPTILKKEILLNSDHLNVIQQGMYDVVHSRHGTARGISRGDYRIAGKTGTSQLQSTFGEDIENAKRNALFTGYAPFNNPLIAVSVIVEDAEEGGSSVAAPIARNIIDFYLNKENNIFPNYYQRWISNYES